MTMLKMQPIFFVCCITISAVVGAHVGLVARNAQQAETRAIDPGVRSVNAITGKQPRSVTHLHARPRGKMAVLVVGKGDHSISGDNPASRPSEGKSPTKNPERVIGGNSSVTSANVPQNEARGPESNEHAEATAGRPRDVKRTAEGATWLSAAVKRLHDGTAIDPEIPAESRRGDQRRGTGISRRGGTGIRNGALTRSLLNENRRGRHTSQARNGHATGFRFAQRVHTLGWDSSAQRWSPLPSSASSGGDVGTVSIFFRPDPRTAGGEVARAGGGWKRNSPPAAWSGKSPSLPLLQPSAAVWKSELPPRRSAVQKMDPLPPPYPLPAPRPPSRDRWKSGPEITGSDDSIKVSSGTGERPAAANDGGTAAADGAEVADPSLTACGHSGSTSPLSPSAEKMRVADSGRTMKVVVNVGRGRVRRDANNNGVVDVTDTGSTAMGAGTNNAGNLVVAKATDSVGGTNSTGNVAGAKVTDIVGGTNSTGNVAGAKVTDSVGGTNSTGNVAGAKVVGGTNNTDTVAGATTTNNVGGTNSTGNVAGANATNNAGGTDNTDSVSPSTTDTIRNTNSTDAVGGTNGGGTTNSVTDAAVSNGASGSTPTVTSNAGAVVTSSTKVTMTSSTKVTVTSSTKVTMTSSARVTVTSHSDANDADPTTASTAPLDKSSSASVPATTKPAPLPAAESPATTTVKETTTKTAATSPPPRASVVDATSSATSSSSLSTSSSLATKPDKSTSSAATVSDDPLRVTTTEFVASQVAGNKAPKSAEESASASSVQPDSSGTGPASSVDSLSGPPVTTDVTAESDDSAAQAESETSPPSEDPRLGGSRLRFENSVSATDFSSHRTLRSTDASSSSAPTQPATQPGSSAGTDPPGPESPTTSPPADPLAAGGSSSSEDEASTTTPPDPEPSHTTGVTPEAVFGAMWTAEPVPHPEGGAYPEDEGPGGDDQEESVAEPGPDFVNAKMVWQEAWEVHLYFFAALFACLGVYTLVCVLRLWRIHRLLSRRYFVSLNLLMVLLCATRVLYLTLDGYNSNRTFHPSLDYFLYSISFPCLTSAFSIQLYALLQATKMQFLPPTIQKMSLLMTIVVFHFAISIVTDVVVGMYAGMQIMLFVCQLFFILWGLFLFFGYAYIFRRLYLHAVKRQKNVQQNGSSYSGSGGLAKPKSKFTLSVAVKVTFSTAILGLVTVALEVYALVAVYKTFSNDRPQPWPWYGYHTVMRLVEFLMCATMSYVASQPFRYRRGQQSCCCPVLCAPCAEIFCCGADVNRSDAQAGWSDLDQHQLRASFDRGQPNGVSYNHDGFRSNGQPRRGSKGGQKGGGDLTVTAKAKAKIYFSGHDDVTPIVTSQPGSRPTSTTSDTLENTVSTAGSTSVGGGGGGGSSSCNGSGGAGSPCRRTWSPFNDRVFSLPAGPGRCSAAAASTPTTPLWSGVVNSAYTPTTGDPHSPGSQAGGFKSRKSSIASSEFFLGASVSLADSMASELDKAFRSMHEDERACTPARDQHAPSLTSLHALPRDTAGKRLAVTKEATCPDGSVENFLRRPTGDGASASASALRRTLSASGRCSFYETEPLQGRGRGDGEVGEGPRKGAGLGPSGVWHQKLFRSRSDNMVEIRTKAVDNATYMSLLDIERRQQPHPQLQPQTQPQPQTQTHPQPQKDPQPQSQTNPQPQPLLPAARPQSPADRRDVDGGCASSSLVSADAASTQLSVTCVDGGAAIRARDNGHSIREGARRSDGAGEGVENNNSGDFPAGGANWGNDAWSPVPPANNVTKISVNVSGVMASSQAPYCTVIPVGGVGNVGGSERRAGRGLDPSPSRVNPAATPRSTPPVTPRGFGMMNSSKGLLGYGDDGSDDIEV